MRLTVRARHGRALAGCESRHERSGSLDLMGISRGAGGAARLTTGPGEEKRHARHAPRPGWLCSCLGPRLPASVLMSKVNS
jgi:hypothetical protein